MFAHRAFLIVVLWIAFASAILVRRQAGCTNAIYCSPQAGDVWLMNGTAYMATWNTANPIFASASGQIIVKLIDIAQPTGYLEIRQATDSQGYAPFVLTDLDFGGPNDSDNYKVKQVRLSIYPDGSPNQPLGPIFTIIQPGKHGAFPDMSKPIPTSTVTIHSSATDTPVAGQVKKLSTSTIILIAVGSAFALTLLAILIMIMRRRRRKTPPMVVDEFTNNKKNRSLDSTTPLAAPRPISDPDASSINSSHNLSHTTTAATAISTNEAMMIAQKYRQLMRKPSWSKAESTEVERSRAQEIIAQELREEGHDLHNVRRGSAVQVNSLEGESGGSVLHDHQQQ